MKKAIFNIVMALFFFIGIITSNALIAGDMHTIIPAKDKAKKEASSSKKAASKKTISATEQKNIEYTSTEQPAPPALEDHDANNPAINDDCTKEGFDKE